MKNIVKVVSISHPTSLVVFQGEIKARPMPTAAMREQLNKQLESIYQPESVESLLKKRVKAIFPPRQHKDIADTVLHQYAKLEAKNQHQGHSLEKILSICLQKGGILS